MKTRSKRQGSVRHGVGHVDEDKIRLGRAILGTLHELKTPEMLESFLLYAGLENKPLPIHVSAIETDEDPLHASEDQNMFEAFVLDLDGTLYHSLIENPYEYNLIVQNVKEKNIGGLISLSKPEDFRKLPYGSIARLHAVLTTEGFFDNLVFKLSRRSKPGYGDIWGSYIEKDREKSLKLRRGK